jgi:hypothetical protein
MPPFQRIRVAWNSEFTATEREVSVMESNEKANSILLSPADFHRPPLIWTAGLLVFTLGQSTPRPDFRHLGGAVPRIERRRQWDLPGSRWCRVENKQRRLR